MSRTAVIVGAGLGGLATAIRLARDGWSVKVLEKNSRVGGKLDFYSDQGFLWDVGPSLVTMPFVLRDLFDYAGQDIEHYLDLVPVDPVCRYFYPDGKIFNTWANFHHFQIEAARREKDKGEALEKFLSYAKGLFDFTWEAYLNPAASRVQNSKRLFRRSIHLPKTFSFKTLAASIESIFKDPHLRRMFFHYASAHGASPYRASSILNILPYAEMHDGGWYVRGGIYRLAEALERCARDLKVEFLVDAEVSDITLKERGLFKKPQATGVTIGKSIQIPADVVICNADAVHAWSRLIHSKKQASVVRTLERKPFSSSAFVLLLGVKHRYDKLSHHNVFFSSDGLAEYVDIFQKKRPAAEPTISLNISGRIDSTQSPPGQDNYLITVQTPSLEPDHHWENLREGYKNTILERLEKMGLENLRNEIVCEKVITPADLASRTHAYRGSLYGHAVHSAGSFLNRMDNRSSEIDGLYFVGGSTRPGAGIPLVILSGQRVSRMIAQDND
jgi:phytoene desaturase